MAALFQSQKDIRWHSLVLGQQTNYLPINTELSEYPEITPIIF